MYNPFSLEGKTILVTGASSGIGKATAIECSKMGAKVVLTGRNEAKLQQTYDLLMGNGHLMIVADLSCDVDISTIVEKCHQLMDLSIMRDFPSYYRLILSLVIKWSR